MDCIFCKIVKQEIGCAKIFENDKILVFLDIRPANKGHCLVVPKQHYSTLLDIPDEILAELMVTAKKVCKALSLSCGNGGFNILMNNGVVAGQIVPHAHLHVIPRFKDDEVTINWKPKIYINNEIERIRENIIKFL